ncbi:uncharacterized protein LOC133202417 [Saccostrea echinata]|uniref:uncharacterized protein LOC133202417 n=1 Tax=Saccostrea echinata TaxID=191078 RepID=UPI002A82D1AE|nr:uncharacterized protein LOC133202417 [Saccostrea echinata]
MSVKCGAFFQKGDILKKVLVISFIFNFILLFVFVTLLALRSNIHHKSLKEGSDTHAGRLVNNFLEMDTGIKLTEDSVCVSCDELGDSVEAKETLYQFIMKTKCGARFCCYKDKDLKAFISKILELPGQRSTTGNMANLQQNFHWWSNRSNAAHLFLNHTSSPPQWTASNIPGFSFSNLPITENRLQIQREGIYYVYAAFSLNLSKCGPGIPQMYHNITSQHPLLKNTGPELHFMNKYGGFARSGKTRHTSFLSGILHLRRGFEVATQISTSSFLDQTKYSNFFGLFALNI